MSNKKIDLLVPQMRDKAYEFLKLTKARGLDVLIYSTTRTLEEQAKLYRKGRSYFQVKEKAHKYRQRGYHFLADILINVGPQSGPNIVTNAGPAESFHNLGEAFDAVPRLDLDNDGDLDLVWTLKEHKYEWETMMKCGADLGLEVGGYWKKFVDSPHFQLRSGANPTRVYANDPMKLHEILVRNGLINP